MDFPLYSSALTVPCAPLAATLCPTLSLGDSIGRGWDRRQLSAARLPAAPALAGPVSAGWHLHVPV